MQLCLVSPPYTYSNTKLTKESCTLPINLIRHTNKVQDPSESKTPIVVIQHKEHYYVLDGNHRLTYYHNCGCTEIPAWIILPNDQHNICGKTTACLEDFHAGKKSYGELLDDAVAAYHELIKSNPEYV